MGKEESTRRDPRTVQSPRTERRTPPDERKSRRSSDLDDEEGKGGPPESGPERGDRSARRSNATPGRPAASARDRPTDRSSRGRRRPATTAEWPPRDSTVVAVAVAVLASAVVGRGIDATGPMLFGCLAGGGFAVGVRLLNAATPRRVAAGVLLGTAAGIGVVVAPLLSAPLVTAGLAVAGFGTTAAALGVADGDSLFEGLGTLAYGVVSVAVVGIGLVMLDPLSFLFDRVLGVAVFTTGGLYVVEFGVLLAVAAVTVRTALGRLPAAELADRDDRSRVRERIEIHRRTLARLTLVGLAVAVGGALVAAVNPGFLTEGASGAVLELLFGSPLVRLPLLGVILASVAVVVGTFLIRSAGGTLVGRERPVTASVAGLGLALALAVLAEPVVSVGESELPAGAAGTLGEYVAAFGPSGTVLLGTVAAVFLLLLVSLVVPVLESVRVIPERAGGSALAAAGLVIAAAQVTRVGSPPAWVVFVGVVAALLVWDLGEFAVGLREEVGDVSTRQTEGVHAAGSLALGALVVAAATGAHALVTSPARTGPLAVAALAAAILGAIALLAAVRG